MKRGKSKVTNTNFKMYAIAGIIAIVLSIGIFFFLTMSEKVILDGAEKQTVFVAKENIPSGTVLDKPDYFKEVTINSKIVPKNAVTSVEDVKDKYALIKIEKDTIITKSMVKKPENIKGDKMIGFSCDDLATSVNGIIRTSDYIDIYIINEEEDGSSFSSNNANPEGETSVADEEGNITSVTSSLKPTFTNIYVSSAFDEKGTLIVNSDATSIAKNFNIIVDKKDADTIVNAINDKTIYIVKNVSKQE